MSLPRRQSLTEASTEGSLRMMALRVSGCHRGFCKLTPAAAAPTPVLSLASDCPVGRNGSHAAPGSLPLPLKATATSAS